jgi:hypothetical protein
MNASNCCVDRSQGTDSEKALSIVHKTKGANMNNGRPLALDLCIKSLEAVASPLVIAMLCGLPITLPTTISQSINQ